MIEYKYVTVKSSEENIPAAKAFIDSIPRNFLHHLYAVENSPERLKLEWYDWYPSTYQSGNSVSVEGQRLNIESSILTSLRLPSSLETSLATLIRYKSDQSLAIPKNILAHIQMLETAGLVTCEIDHQFAGLSQDGSQMLFESSVREYAVTEAGNAYAAEHHLL